MTRETERLAAEAKEEEDKEKDESSKHFLGLCTSLQIYSVPTLSFETPLRLG